MVNLQIKSKSLMEWVAFDFLQEPDTRQCFVQRYLEQTGPVEVKGAGWLLSERRS